MYLSFSRFYLASGKVKIAKTLAVIDIFALQMNVSSSVKRYKYLAYAKLLPQTRTAFLIF